VQAQVLRGSALNPGDVVEGPAVIEHPGTTIFVGPDQRATIDELDNTMVTFGSPADRGGANGRVG
jgi:N-methylhydantoinase A